MIFSEANVEPFSTRKKGGRLFNFVIDCTDAALEEYLTITQEDYARVFTKVDLNWCLQAYHILTKRGNLPVQCSNSLLNGHINIIHSDQLLKLRGDAKKFAVCVRADYPRRKWAHYELVQNKQQLTANTSFIPHWIQPGLLKRNPGRVGVSRVAYAGAPIMGNLAGTAEYWKKLFHPHGIEFVLLPSGRWHDLSTVDVLIGIRSFSKYPFHTKPPTKLFSAWHANIPFIGGYDSAFMQVGEPGKDYLLAEKPEEVVSAVLQLRQRPSMYAGLVSLGQQKARQYTEETIALCWEETLAGPVMDRFLQWKENTTYEQIRFSLLKEVGLAEHKTKQMVKKILKGSKITPLVKKEIY